jgi:hypothetical protein
MKAEADDRSSCAINWFWIEFNSGNSTTITSTSLCHSSLNYAFQNPSANSCKEMSFFKESNWIWTPVDCVCSRHRKIVTSQSNFNQCSRKSLWLGMKTREVAKNRIWSVSSSRIISELCFCLTSPVCEETSNCPKREPSYWRENVHLTPMMIKLATPALRYGSAVLLLKSELSHEG